MAAAELSSPKLSARFCRLVLRLFGWKIEAPLPTTRKAVIIAAPHTSNLDGLLLVMITRAIAMDSKWLVKDTWTKPPIGWLTRRVGAVGVDRSKKNGMVGQMAEIFESTDDFLLMVPPEGTRSLAEHWRSGFYRIALEAEVPILPSVLDYANKRGVFHEPIALTGDVTTDMDAIRAVYGDMAQIAKKPEKYGPVRLRDEA